MHISLAQVRRATGGELVASGIAESFAGIAVDSRSTGAGELFVAIRGARRDGHDFIREVLERGATGVVVERWPIVGVPDRFKPAVVRVGDSLHALGQIAASARSALSARVVAITGTAGKTTTKAMTVEVLRAGVGSALAGGVGASTGSENNLVGLPITILRLDGTEAAVVLEMGMNALGEIARMTEIADPDIGLITNIGLAHLRPSPGSLSLGAGPMPLDSLEGVIRAKGELWAGMRRDGLAIVNLDDPNVASLAAARGGPTLTYSRQPNADADVGCEHRRERGVDGQNFILRAGGQRAEVELAAAGEHHLSNALAAAAVGIAFRIPAGLIAKGLANFRPVAMRGEVIAIAPDVVCINDAYNANPVSMAAALRMLAAFPGTRRIAALGDMRELGEAAPAAHREMGALAATLKIDRLLAVGEYGEEMARGARANGMTAERIRIFVKPSELGAALGEMVRAGDRILLKASRAVGLEAVLEQFGRAGQH
jgi:UDP-N-acetylmuramoyl-tripeptide--D-alanyl-D-alanine ligase